MGGGQLSAAPTGPQVPQVVQQQVQQQQVQQQQVQQQQAQQQQQQANNPAAAGVPVRTGEAPDLKHLEAQRQQNLMTIKQLQQNLEAAQQKEILLKVPCVMLCYFPS